MRQYHTTVKETKEIDKIICNRCGRSIPVIQGVPREDVLEVSKRWGYFSEKTTGWMNLTSASSATMKL